MSDLNYLKKSSKVKYLGEISKYYLYFQTQTDHDIFLGKFEHQYLEMLDGTRSNQKLSEITKLDLADINKLNDLLYKKNLIEGSYKKKKDKIRNYIFFSIYSKSKKREITGFRHYYLCFFWISFLLPLFIIPWIAKEISITVLFYRIVSSKIIDIISYIAIAFFSIFIHESGHVIMSKLCGAFVVRYDFKLLSFFPCIATVICGLSKLGLRNRIKISLAGISNNLWLSFVGIVLSMILFQNHMLNFFIIFNFSVVLFNSIIFIETDGWQIINLLSQYGDNFSVASDSDFKYYNVNNIVLFLRILMAIVLAALFL